MSENLTTVSGISGNWPRLGEISGGNTIKHHFLMLKISTFSSLSYNKTGEACLFKHHANMMFLSCNVNNRAEYWHFYLGTLRKGKETYLYSAFYILCISQSTPAWITQFYLQIHHACLTSVHHLYNVVCDDILTVLSVRNGRVCNSCSCV